MLSTSGCWESNVSLQSWSEKINVMRSQLSIKSRGIGQMEAEPHGVWGSPVIHLWRTGSRVRRKALEGRSSEDLGEGTQETPLLSLLLLQLLLLLFITLALSSARLPWKKTDVLKDPGSLYLLCSRGKPRLKLDTHPWFQISNSGPT